MEAKEGRGAFSLENVLDLRLTRGEFLKILGAAVVLGAVGAGLKLSFDKDRQAIQKEEGKDVFPGWIEADLKSPFIQEDKGHFKFLREAVFSNPIIKEATREYFGYLNENLKAGKRIGLGDALKKAIELAQDKLSSKDPSKISDKVKLNLESLHAGLFVFAAGFMTFFETEDLEELDVLPKGVKSAEEYFSGKNGIQTKVYPRIIKDGKNHEEMFANGQDRAVHFAQHLFITFEYLYSELFKLGINEKMPSYLKFLVKALGGGDVKKRAKVFSWLTGVLYEVSSLSESKNRPVLTFLGVKTEGIKEGIFEPTVNYDLEANKFAAKTAIEIMTQVLNNGQIGDIFEELNSQE